MTSRRYTRAFRVPEENPDVDPVVGVNAPSTKTDSVDSSPCPDDHDREDPESTIEFMDQYLDDSDESDGKIVPEEHS